jgi:hypothetical protein
MKRALFTLVAIFLIAVTMGCCHDRMYCGSCMHGSCAKCPDTCQSCDSGCHRGCGRRRPDPDAFMPGPPTGAITYPYYTVRGPRDFLASDPRSIGP